MINKKNSFMRNKKVVRLTESQLHSIIAKSVNKILKEGLYGTNGNDANSWHKVAQLRQERLKNDQGDFDKNLNGFTRNNDNMIHIAKEGLKNNIRELQFKIQLLKCQEQTPEVQDEIQRIQNKIDEYSQYV